MDQEIRALQFKFGIVDLHKSPLRIRSLTDGNVRCSLSLCERLFVVNLNDCSLVTDTTLQMIAARPQFLSVVHLHRCYRLTDEGVEMLTRCPHIISLDISECSSVTVKGVQYIASGLPRLSSVNLKNIQVTDMGVKALADKCKLLEVIIIASTHVTDIGVWFLIDLPAITTLDISCNSAVTDNGLKKLAGGSSPIRILDLKFCQKLTDDSMKIIAE